MVSGFVIPRKDQNQYGVDKEPKCHTEVMTEYRDLCEPYIEETCLTQNEEVCVEEMLKNCTAVIETDIERVCFNVTEHVCSLEEVIHYDTVEESYQVMACFRTKDMVCDTVYNTDRLPKDDYQCLQVEIPKCSLEEQVINDVICTDTVDFRCSREMLPDIYKNRELLCGRFPRKDCYSIPRKVLIEVCAQDHYDYCEKFTNLEPIPVEDQNCHLESKKICHVRGMSRPRKVQRFSYVKDCKEVARQICDQVEKKSIRPRCDEQGRLKCSYEPVESCRESDELFCHKVEEVSEVEVCDNKFATSYL